MAAKLTDGPPRPNLSDDQKIAWLRLIRSENIGPVTFTDLINLCGSAEEAIKQLPDLARQKKSKKPIKICSLEQAEREFSTIRNKGWHIVARGEEFYPEPLNSFPSSPPLLTISGDINALKKPAIAIVGSRNASANGKKFATQLASELAESGFLITSGFARGIDAAAHSGALKPQGTAAIFAGGIDVIYPTENKELFQAINDFNGCFISEMPLGRTPRSQDFPRRNRIVAGMSYATIVIEANLRSGSLITARLANEMGRIVFAVPGSPLDPRASGTNRLLRDGATILTETRDVIDCIVPLIENGPEFWDGAFQDHEATDNAQDIRSLLLSDPDNLSLNLQTNDEPETSPQLAQNNLEIIISQLSQSPTDMNVVLRATGLTSGQFHLALIELKLSGRISMDSGMITLLD